jgi:hypothetical protein
MVYHKPAFKGKVIDAETKEPIEGAVVVVTYSKSTVMVPESYTSIINVRETLTNKNGEFYIPSYTTIIQPLSSEDMAWFIIFKPGYGSFPDWRVTPPKLMLSKVPYGNYWYGERDLTFEEFFSGEVGTVKEFWGREIFSNEKPQKIKLTFGLVELPKLKTREERRDSLPSIPGPGIPSIKIKNLIRLSNEERISLGLKPEEWP